MLFNSGQFLLFFPIVLALYFTLAQRWRIYLLFGSSCIFYMAFVPKYILILFLIILIDYAAGLQIHRRQGRSRRAWLILSLVTNVALLAVFKYCHFLGDNLSGFLNFLGLNYNIPNLDLLLPIGLSFHTFQAMSYTIEVYRGRQAPERSLIHYAVYVLFFPQMVAGPIERPQNILHQFREKHSFSFQRFAEGARWMLWGLFKKVAVADLVAPVVNTVFQNPGQFSGPYLLLATCLFSIQIYCDFSGYSDIARGCAHVFGYRLMVNFRQPYFARSISEFWQRWHISLSTWFRDYLYIPLGGNRVAKPRWLLNLFIVFAISGFWHGAAWNFLIWGALHGGYLVFAILTDSWRQRLRSALGLHQSSLYSHLVQPVIVFTLVSIAWVFFRARSFEDAWYMLTHFHVWSQAELQTLWGLGLARFEICLSIVVIALLFMVESLQVSQPRWLQHWWEARPVRWACYSAAFYWIVFFGVFGRVEFIYFQF